MTHQPIWQEQAAINFSETDIAQKWKPSAFFSAMQEAGSHHATHLGFDYRDMFAAGMSWVLSRAIIQFDQFPQAGQTVTIQTWPKGIHNKLFFMRDFFILGADGSRLAAATCAFVLIDLHARRVLPWRALKGELPDNQGRSAMDEFPEKLGAAEGLEEIFTRLTAYSDVDLMGHVNNTRYIEWICDCFPVEYHQAHALQLLQINYLNEVKPAETISVLCAGDSADACLSRVEGKNMSAGNVAFEAALKWK
jgi:medium-chain acyl-[acyl-carrier-protein] hydrolase